MFALISSVSSPNETAVVRAVRNFWKLLQRKSWVFWLAAVLCLMAMLYWGAIASSRYVSEAHVIIQQTDAPMGSGGFDVSSLLVGMTGSPGRADQMLLREHLLSVDMLTKLDGQLDLRDHYSDRSWDVVSRLWWRDISQEWFHWYYLWRVSVDFDEYTGVLIIQAEAFTPEKAHAIAAALVQEGERYMNDLGHRLAQAQVAFIEKQVAGISARLLHARQAVLKFQNERNLVSPQGTADALFTIVSQLEGQLTTLKTQRAAYLGYQQARSPAVIDLDMQIEAVKNQILQEQARLTSSERQTLNRIIEEYQRLEMEAEFAQDMYKTALSSLEKQRVDAGRTLRVVSVLQSPTHPQYPLQPRRIYNSVTFILAVLVLSGILNLLRVIVREHRD